MGAMHGREESQFTMEKKVVFFFPAPLPPQQQSSLPVPGVFIFSRSNGIPALCFEVLR